MLCVLLVGVIFLPLFVWREWQQRDPLIDLHLFRSPAFSGARWCSSAWDWACSSLPTTARPSPPLPGLEPARLEACSISCEPWVAQLASRPHRLRSHGVWTCLPGTVIRP